ncbi:hypothetical protein DES45_11544 [Microvirga subterranea]|uniref:Uncharacterized protein n=1 Tax=Microvirga subterranea TaxID=186651 RepID=A0A370H7Y7_9HYPH|nr:hypothetical protein DES45_11544 [Microvirga subterranea]
MKAFLGLISAAVLLFAIGGEAWAQSSPSNRSCKRGEQMKAGVCQPITRGSSNR